ncbi:PIN domain-containing protein [Candidatus Daviesbacteria bacterium]|nr:PIN domain-containing protein [Candidatus Daviesbacteria bacterium]
MAFGLAFLDTNVIIRYLTKDNPQQSQRSYIFLKGVEAGTEQVETNEAVIIEVVQVLSSKVLYNLPREQIHEHIQNVLSFRGLRIPKKHTVRKALTLYASTSLDFVDCLIACHVQQSHLPALISFDEDFDGLPGVDRRAP